MPLVQEQLGLKYNRFKFGLGYEVRPVSKQNKNIYIDKRPDGLVNCVPYSLFQPQDCDIMVLSLRVLFLPL